MTSCNSKDSDSYLNPKNVAVTEFSLKSDLNNPGLDSVYFSIDLEHGIIFNADSLRKGTQIDKVIPLITFSNTPSEATIIMSGGTTREGEVNYKTNPTDSIDFTGDVLLRVKADDNEIEKTYRIKVNVHKIETDSLFWDNIDYKNMGSRMDNPRKMKTIEVENMPVSLVEEKDGSYSIITYNSAEEMRPTAREITFPFEPAVHTLCTDEVETWMLDSRGALWRGDLTLSGWQDTGEIWRALIGTYNQSVVGLRESGTSTYFAQYPLININEKIIPEDFPVSGYSNFVTLTNKWTLSPVAFFTGGIESDGTLSDSTWAFDGAEWIRLSSGGIPALEGSSLIPYYNYRPSADGTSMIEYRVWLLLGGRESDGTFNRDLYISYNNGVNWTLGASSLQLPDIIPATYYCDNVVIDLEKSADLSAGWSRAVKSPRKIDYSVNGDIITWECPYIYLFGGYSESGKLNTTIWRGVLGRLTFTPII